MQLTPRYGADPLVTIAGDPTAIAEPAIRQRRRMVDALATFTDDQWAHQTRCDDWSARDVVVHLDGTNAFWTQSVAAGRRGEPSCFLATFDPVTSPARMVEQARDLTAAQVLDRFAESTDTLVRLLESLDDAEWSALAEAPPGHLTTAVVIHHALWDSWIHERDILLPRAIDPTVEVDEVAACLRYAAALGPALGLTRGQRRRGTLGIRATDPDVACTVEISDHVAVVDAGAHVDATLIGPACDLVDALSARRPLDHPLPVAHAWMTSGLSETFDRET